MQYEREKKKKGGTGANQYNSKEDKMSIQLTAEKLAEQHKVSERTIRDDGNFAKAVDKSLTL